jgi:hypothetical protein
MMGKKVVKDVKGGAKALVPKRGPKSVRSLPKIVKSVNRMAPVPRSRPFPSADNRAPATAAKSPSLRLRLRMLSPNLNAPARAIP